MQKLKEKREYLAKWLERLSQAKDAAEEAKKHLDYTDWQISVVESRPESADEIPFPDLGPTLDSDIAHLPDAYPMIPGLNKGQMLSASAFTSSGTQDISAYVGRVGDLGADDAHQYVNLHLDRLDELRKIYDRPEEVRSLVAKLANEATLDRVENALSSYLAYQTSTGTRSAAAADIRTLLDGIKGDLFELARQHEGENMTWERMARRLVRGAIPGPEYDEMVRLKQKRSSLISRLSDVIKNREGGSLTNLDQLWMQTQDHIVSTLGLLELPEQD